MTTQPDSPGALDGLRVLEVADEAAEHCGKLMADLGADVIKVEPHGGSPTREVGPFYRDIPDPNRSLYFWHYNTSKRSVTLDLETPDGRGLFQALARNADIILESNAPGVMPARGLGYEELRKVNPRLIYCSVTPFGQDGPWSTFKASELTLMASGGQMGVCGYEAIDDPDETPIAPGGGNAWHLGTHYACIAILLALRARERLGVGQYIDLSTHEAIALCTEGSFPDWVGYGQNKKRQTGRHANLRGSGQIQFRCKDGRYVNCMMPRISTEDWLRVVEWFEREGQAEDFTDDKYLDPAVLQGEMRHVMQVVGRFCAAHTAEEVYHGAQSLKLPWGVVWAPSDLLDEPHHHDRGFFVQVEHPELGERFTYPGAPYIFQKTPWRIRRRAPLLGEDNLAIYHQELGLPIDRLNALAELRVI